MARLKKDVQHELSQLSNDIRALQGNKEKETEYRAAMDKMVVLTTELNDIHVQEAADRALAAGQVDKEVEQAARRFSFVKFFRELGQERNASLTGVEKEMADLAAEESVRAGFALKGVGIPIAVLNNRTRAFNGMTAGVPEDGGLTIATQLQYQDELRKRLVLAKAGTRMLSGLVGDIHLIEGDAVTVRWEGENTKAKRDKIQFTGRKFSPKRVALIIPLSKQLTIQSSWDVEKMVFDKLINAHASAVEEAAINGSGTGQPLGILNTSGIGSIRGR